jgi:serine/threonine protein kinase
MTLTATGAAPDDDFPDGYRPIRLIARCGREIWKAEAGAAGAVVAVHILPNWGDREEMLQAFQTRRQLLHPFVLVVQEVFLWKNRLVVVTELAEGCLSDRLKECIQQGLPGIPVPELLGHVGEAAQALDYLHGKEVLHRDIKPMTLIRLRGHTKLDPLLAPPPRTSGDTTTFCGTPLYMAPEAWNSKACPASDQYALAVSYFEMRMGRRLFIATNPRDLALQHMQSKPDLTPLPRAERKVLEKALAKQPRQRYPTCLALAQVLQKAAPR